jgi:hypothetical protein
MLNLDLIRIRLMKEFCKMAGESHTQSKM